MDFRSRVQTFAKDFVFCFMKQWRPEWEPEQSCSERTSNSPFTDNMKNKIGTFLEEGNRHEFQMSFEREFPAAKINERSFQLKADRYKHDFMILCEINSTCSPEELYSFCLKLAKFAGLAVCFNVQSAPFIAIDTISQVIRSLNSNTLFNESTWTELDAFCSEE